MSKKSPASQIAHLALRSWTGCLTSSLVLVGSVSVLAQEPNPPKALPIPKNLEMPTAFDSLALDRHSCLELENDALPLFPVDNNIARPKSTGYLPAALRNDGHRLLPTGIPANVARQESDDVLVLAVEAPAPSPEPNPTTTSEPAGLPIQGTQGWSLRSVQELELAMYSDRKRPDDAAGATLSAAENGTHPAIANVGTVAAWIAPNLTYQPLFFEDARLERYGYASPYFGIQPVRSGVHFASSSIVFPWRVWFHRNECESPLAFERPGSCAPMTREVFVPALSRGR